MIYIYICLFILLSRRYGCFDQPLPTWDWSAGYVLVFYSTGTVWVSGIQGDFPNCINMMSFLNMNIHPLEETGEGRVERGADRSRLEYRSDRK